IMPETEQAEEKAEPVEDVSAKSDESPTSPKPEKEEAPEELPLDEYIEAWLIDDLGEDAEKGVPSVESVIVGDGEIFLSLNKSITLSGNMARKSMMMSTKELTQALVEEREYSGLLAVKWSAPLVDQYGNEEYAMVIQAEYE